MARQGWYGRRPKVEMPEKTESACDREGVNLCPHLHKGIDIADLRAAIARQLVEPEGLVRAGEAALLVSRVGGGESCPAKGEEGGVVHG
jgi:hypothetical protein